MKRQFYSEQQLKCITKSLKKKLNNKRYVHSLGVSQTAIALAMCYGEDLEHAQIAGLLHDCAKCLSNKKLLKESKIANIEIDMIQIENPFLLHGPLGSYYAHATYHISNEDVLNAIYHHTLGRSNMTVLEKIIYVADYIEPNREKLKDLYELRQMAFQDLDKTVYQIAVNSIEHLQKQNKTIHKKSYEIIEAYS
ncbi:MAG: bis(5'-nucleosyl)-tetraphosphatase (symmetrical) YqeK [Eubacteriales bacterium]